MIRFLNDARLLYRGRLLLRFANSPKLAHRNLPRAQFCLPDTSEFKDQQIATLCLVQVLRQASSPPKALRVLLVHLHGFKKGDPSPM